MSRRESRDSVALIYGGVPRARLMPPEVARQRKERARRRGLATLVVIVLGLVVGGVAWAYWNAAQAEARLADERATTEELLARQLEFTDVLKLRSQLSSGEERRSDVAGVEILWREQLDPYLDVLDSDEVVDSITAESNVPFAVPLVLQGPLRAPREGTFVITVRTDGLPDAAAWFRAFEDVPSFADASIDSVVGGEGDEYTTTIRVNLNSLALSDRFLDANDSDAEAESGEEENS